MRYLPVVRFEKLNPRETDQFKMIKDQNRARKVYGTFRALPVDLPPSAGGEDLIYRTQHVTSTGTTDIALLDEYVTVNAPGIVTLRLPSSPVDGEGHIFKDTSGVASVNNITIDGNGNLIDGISTYEMSIDYQGIQVVYSVASGMWSLV